MRRSLFLSALLFACIASAQQMPYFPIDNYAPTSGAQTISATFGMVTPTNVATPVSVSQTAQINFVAGTRLALHPGFSAGSFSGSGYFHGQIGTAPDFDVVFITPNQNTPFVGQFEKLEIGMTLPAVVEQQVNDFLVNSTGGLNPFDPEQISVEANFTNGVDSYMAYGFYYDEFIRDPNAMAPFAPANWIAQPTDYHWRIRFAPPMIGNWYCTISIRLNNASNYAYAVNSLYFQCVPSSNEGWLKKGNNDWYLKYSGTNRSFFAIAQNIGWNDLQSFYGGATYPANPNYAVSASGYLDVLDWIADLADNGGNMFRSVNVGNAFELELHRLGNYADRMDRAWEMDRLFELCEQKNMKISLQFADLRFAAENGNFGWPDNPYHTQIPLADKKDFFTNTTAKAYFIKKLRYFLSRWGYSTSIGIFALDGEIDGNNISSDYKNDHTLQENQTAWHEELFVFAKTMMYYRPLLTTTSYTYGLRGSDFHRNFPLQLRTPFDLPLCDITSMHSYHNERGSNFERYDEFNEGAFDPGLHATWDEKPTYFEEIGLALGQGADPGDIEGCSDISYHNNLWATSFMGGFGTGFVWYQWHRNDYRHDNFPALNAFFDGVDLEGIKFKHPDFWDDAPLFNGDHSRSNIETFYITDESGKRAMGWMHNSTYWWGNIDQECQDRNNHTMNPANDDDASASPSPLGNYFIVEVHGMNNGKNYTIDYYNTRGNGGQYNSLTKQSNIFGTLKPNWIDNNPDLAFKAYRSGYNFREGGEIDADTLFCWQDTVYAFGNHENDSLRQFHYHWNFGNGQQSFNRNDTVIYSQPGAYLVTLIVSDSIGWSDTLRQYIVKPEPCIASRLSPDTDVNTKASWSVYPNPLSTSLTLAFDSSWSSIVSVEFYALDGRCIRKQNIISSTNETLDVTDVSPGPYLLRVSDGKHSEIQQIIVVH